jgi:nudix motif 8
LSLRRWDTSAIAERLAAQKRVQLRPSSRTAAVLVPLVDAARGPSVLFTVRTHDVPTHKGQVAFPGGMREERDSSHVDTALRELEEELAVPAHEVEVLGALHDTLSIHGVVVTPVLGYLREPGRLEQLVLSPREIASTFVLSLDQLTDPALQDTMEHSHRGKLPVYRGGPEPVWGLTAFILQQALRDALVASAR